MPKERYVEGVGAAARLGLAEVPHHLQDCDKVYLIDDVESIESGCDDPLGTGHMGTFSVEATFRSLHDRTRTRIVPVLVDTGATWTTLPHEAIEALGSSAVSSRRVRLANGREETWPVTVLLVTLEGEELPTVCLIGPRGGPALLGTVTLEEFSLSADPVGRRLVPVSGYLMSSS